MVLIFRLLDVVGETLLQQSQFVLALLALQLPGGRAFVLHGRLDSMHFEYFVHLLLNTWVSLAL